VKGYVKQEGFTLIELIVVIVILGILAVTAAPKFIDLQGDARASALQGLAGAMKGAATLVHGKALVANKVSSEAQYVCIGSTSQSSCNQSSKDAVQVKCGFPDATKDGILRALDGTFSEDGNSDWTYKFVTWPSGATQILVSVKGVTFPDAYQTEYPETYTNQCYVFYNTPCYKDTNSMHNGNLGGTQIKVFTDGC
jgi:MSHA pilin protein MshA